jgi:hypothetical protein
MSVSRIDKPTQFSVDSIKGGIGYNATVGNFQVVGSTPSSSLVTTTVLTTGGDSRTLMTMEGEQANPNTVFYEYTFDCTIPGVLECALIGAGGSGGWNQWTLNAGAGAGAGGLILSKLSSPKIHLPLTGTYTVTVAGKNIVINTSYSGQKIAGQNTIIKHSSGLVVASAIGGGSSPGLISTSGYPTRSGFGGSSAGMFAAQQNSWPLSGVEGQGFEGGYAHNYSPGGGGGGAGQRGRHSTNYDGRFGGVAETGKGGDGVDIFSYWSLDAADATTASWRSTYTDGSGYVAGGGNGGSASPNTRSAGGGGLHGNPGSDGLIHTGSGGGSCNAPGSVGGAGASGAAHIFIN